MFIPVTHKCYTSNPPERMHFGVTPYVGDSMTWYGAASFDDSSAFDTPCNSNADYLYDEVYTDGTGYDAEYCLDMAMARNPSL